MTELMTREHPMLDLAIVLALVVLNALVQSAYVRWRRTPKQRRARVAQRRAISYPSHPSPGWADLPEHAVAIRPVGIDW